MKLNILCVKLQWIYHVKSFWEYAVDGRERLHRVVQSPALSSQNAADISWGGHFSAFSYNIPVKKWADSFDLTWTWYGVNITEHRFFLSIPNFRELLCTLHSSGLKIHVKVYNAKVWSPPWFCGSTTSHLIDYISVSAVCFQFFFNVHDTKGKLFGWRPSYQVKLRRYIIFVTCFCQDEYSDTFQRNH